MVKFSRELDAQLIPEWRDAFVDYWRLKKLVKEIKISPKRSPKNKANNYGVQTWGFGIGSVMIQSICRLTESVAHKFHDSDANDDAIQMRSECVEGGVDSGQAHGNGIEAVNLFPRGIQFMEAVEEEHNKVNEFYKKREEEFMERGVALLNQLRTLLLLKQPPATTLLPHTHRPHHVNYDIPLSKNDGEEIASLRFRDQPTDRKRTKARTTDVIGATTSMNCEYVESAPPWKDETMIGSSSLHTKDIQRAEKTIRGAFVDLYRALGLLKKFSTLNFLAFVKILKKFDKVSSQKASQHYLETVKGSHFYASDKVIKLMLDVESVFTEHFADNDRKKAMMFLRPRQRRESHTVTFLVGLLTGCFVTLFSLYATLAHALGLFSSDSSPDYVEAFYPVFSIFALFGLHLFMHGCNIFLWKKTGINNNFIFEFSPNTALKYRDAFLLSTMLVTAVVSTMVVDLLLRGKSRPITQLDAIPEILLAAFIGSLFCPFDVFYRSTRYCFIRIMRNIVCAPFSKVVMADFFMADQLTSQVPLMRHIETTACYILVGNFQTHHYNTCKSGRLYGELVYVISFLPYYWRFMQCGRRWYDGGNRLHIANMGKYLSAMVAAGARISYARQPTIACYVVVLATSVAATLYQLYWDYVQDWGLLDPNSSNRWLRNDLVLKNKGTYYVSIAFNLVLRVTWVVTVLQFRVGVVGSRLLEFSLASLEVVRRGHWNFYRLENEHLNNVGKFRVVKSVPLPFRDDSDD